MKRPDLHAKEPELDGRVRRGARNRERIAEALIALVREGALRPTAEQVAGRAGVGARTVFRHFADMDSLYAEMNERISATLRRLRPDPPKGGNLSARISRLVEWRVALYEQIAPFQRSEIIHRWSSAFLAESHATMVRNLRAELLEWLPELRDAEDWVFEALDLAVSFEAWNRLRSDQRLGRERARTTMERTARALLSR